MGTQMGKGLFTHRSIWEHAGRSLRPRSVTLLEWKLKYKTQSCPASSMIKALGLRTTVTTWTNRIRMNFKSPTKSSTYYNAKDLKEQPEPQAVSIPTFVCSPVTYLRYGYILGYCSARPYNLNASTCSATPNPTLRSPCPLAVSKSADNVSGRQLDRSAHRMGK